jgi:hypothetical protein
VAILAEDDHNLKLEQLAIEVEKLVHVIMRDETSYLLPALSSGPDQCAVYQIRVTLPHTLNGILRVPRPVFALASANCHDFGVSNYSR